MPNDLIRYDLLVQEALCGVVKKVLADVAKNNSLPGDHHFYITFRTHAPGVRLSSRMRELYPEEMTIILQHQFENLKVTEQALEVGLSFKGISETLLIPFDALTGFFDPSVQFSAKFEPQTEGDDVQDEEPTAPTRPSKFPAPAPVLAAVPSGDDSHASPARAPAAKGSSEQEDGDEKAKVVSIDAFRKKP